MSSTTGEHTNELEERRQRRQERNAARSGPAKPPRSAITAPEARDLLRDLITEGSRLDEGGAGHLNAGSLRATKDSRNGSIGTESKHQPSARRNSEGVDELVRRVQAGAQTLAEEAERTTRRSRPTGTADLAADAAIRTPARRRAGRRLVDAIPRRLEAKAWAAWAATAAIVLIAGVVLALSLDSAGGRRTASTQSAPSFAPVASLASAVRTAISEGNRELDALTHRATNKARRARRVIKRPRSRPRQHHAPTTQTPAATQDQPVHVVSPPTTSSPTRTSTQQPSTSSGRSTAGGASSSSGSAQPAGPTNASPLGGIGSCVRGCS